MFLIDMWHRPERSYEDIVGGRNLLETLNKNIDHPYWKRRRLVTRINNFGVKIQHWPKLALQKHKKGYNYESLWDLDHYLAKLLADSIRELSVVTHGYPPDIVYPSNWDSLTPEQADESFEAWKNILVEIADGLQAYVDFDKMKIEPYTYTEEFDKVMERVRNSFRLMGEHLPGMWD